MLISGGDEEVAQAVERMEEKAAKRRAAQALADLFVANADAGNDAANTDLVTEMKRRMQ